LDQVLLERVDPEGERNLEVGERAVGAVGVYEELAVAPEETRRHARVLELGPGEVAEHRLVGCGRHRLEVMRACPGLRLRRMTVDARAVADVGYASGRGGGGWLRAADGHLPRADPPPPEHPRRRGKAAEQEHPLPAVTAWGTARGADLLARGAATDAALPLLAQRPNPVAWAPDLPRCSPRGYRVARGR